MELWLKNTWSKRYRRARRRRCKAVPDRAIFCDGCKSPSSKCPDRYKERELRTRNKRSWRKEWKGEF